MAAPLNFLAKPQIAAAMTPAVLGQKTPKSAQTPKTPKTPVAATSFFIAANAVQTPKTPKTPTACAPSFFMTAVQSSQASAAAGVQLVANRRVQWSLDTTTPGSTELCPDAGRAAPSHQSSSSPFFVHADGLQTASGYPTLLNQLTQPPSRSSPMQPESLALAKPTSNPAALPVQLATNAREVYLDRQSHIDGRQLPFHM